MKISVRQYAQSLYESVQGKKGGELKAVLEKFVRLLALHRELGRAEAIIAVFVDIWEREEGELNANMLSARSLDKAALSKISNYLKGRTGVKQVELKAATDKDLIGGFILRYRDQILDASLKTSLSDLRSKLAG